MYDVKHVAKSKRCSLEFWLSSLPSCVVRLPRPTFDRELATFAKSNLIAIFRKED